VCERFERAFVRAAYGALRANCSDGGCDVFGAFVDEGRRAGAAAAAAPCNAPLLILGLNRDDTMLMVAMVFVALIAWLCKGGGPRAWHAYTPLEPRARADEHGDGDGLGARAPLHHRSHGCNAEQHAARAVMIDASTSMPPSPLLQPSLPDEKNALLPPPRSPPMSSASVVAGATAAAPAGHDHHDHAVHACARDVIEKAGVN
jgi:hypothetical protein